MTAETDWIDLAGRLGLDYEPESVSAEFIPVLAHVRSVIGNGNYWQVSEDELFDLYCLCRISGAKVVIETGDTGVFKDMELIRELYHPQISLLPIGGYYTMHVKEATYAASMLRSKYTIPMHYNTFDAIRSDPVLFKNNVEKAGYSSVIIAEVGKEIKFDDSGNRLD